MFFRGRFCFQKNLRYLCCNKNAKVMEKKTIEMSQAEYKRFLAFKEADRIVRGIKRNIKKNHKTLFANEITA